MVSGRVDFFSPIFMCESDWRQLWKPDQAYTISSQFENYALVSLKSYQKMEVKFLDLNLCQASVLGDGSYLLYLLVVNIC